MKKLSDENSRPVQSNGSYLAVDTDFIVNDSENTATLLGDLKRSDLVRKIDVISTEGNRLLIRLTLESGGNRGMDRTIGFLGRISEARAA